MRDFNEKQVVNLEQINGSFISNYAFKNRQNKNEQL